MTEQIERVEEAAERAAAAAGSGPATTPALPRSAGRRSGRPTRPSYPADDGSRERRYVLDMFPYPSGDLHMGHAEAFVMGDVVARYLQLTGLRRTPPDRLGLLRTARGERGYRAERAPGRVDLRQHRDPGHARSGATG